MSYTAFYPVVTEEYTCGVCLETKPGEDFVGGYYIGPICKRCKSDFDAYGCD
jgi:hypothetical protein